jgi:hypothetical protein
VAAEGAWNGGDIEAVEKSLMGFIFGRGKRSHYERVDE